MALKMGWTIGGELAGVRMATSRLNTQWMTTAPYEFERVKECEAQAYGIVVNSFEELEAEYVKEYQRVTGHKVWCVGPVSLINKEDMEKAQRGSKNSNDATQYVEWLDSWPPSSIIYVCLGSLNRVTPEQLIELGLGLEAKKRPFIWVR